MVILYYFLLTIFALFTFLCENNRKNVGMRIDCEFYFDFNEVRQSMYVLNFFCIVFAEKK